MKVEYQCIVLSLGQDRLFSLPVLCLCVSGQDRWDHLSSLKVSLLVIQVTWANLPTLKQIEQIAQQYHAQKAHSFVPSAEWGTYPL